MDKLLKAVWPVLWEAGELSLSMRQSGLNVVNKADGTPCTEADLEVDRMLHEVLGLHYGGIPVISEEISHDRSLAKGQSFFLVDPIDGTRAYIAGEPFFTLNIGFIEKDQAVQGIIYAPQLGQLYWGSRQAGSSEAYRAQIPLKATSLPDISQFETIQAAALGEHTRLITNTQNVNFSSRFLFTPPLAHHERLPSSLKFCRLAEGHADIYISLGHTKSWDTAAGGAILQAAGGFIQTLNLEGQRKPFSYHPPFWANEGFVAGGDQSFQLIKSSQPLDYVAEPRR